MEYGDTLGEDLSDGGPDEQDEDADEIEEEETSLGALRKEAHLGRRWC